MSSRLVALDLNADDPPRRARFWAGLLGRDVSEDSGGMLLPGDDTQIGLRFVASRSESVGPARLHLHLTSAGPGDQARTVEAALGLGARPLDVGQRPEERHDVLADPEGNAFCVIEAGNSFLAGCGFLGEVTCEGTRDVGLFWSRVLDWPLVWDQDGETAVQSPDGGTKISWGGPPVAPKTGPNPQRILLAPADGDQPTEADRLVALGAIRLDPGASGLAGPETRMIAFADPDGNEFALRSP